uniref:NADH dehydrogenase subunit 6 n=1 Tax=Destinoides conspicuus TaxID=3137869 RepID=A0AAU6PBY5_9HEMI
MLKFMFFFSLLSCFMSNPISMTFLLILYSLMISFFVGKMMITSWFCIIIILMMIGGILVIFMYITSISSNESFSFSFFYYFMIMFIPFMYLDETLISFFPLDSIFMILMMDTSESFSLIKLYNLDNLVLTIFMVLYLIFTMIVVSFIVKHFKGPLRSLSYE